MCEYGGCADSDIRSLNTTTIVEGPIDTRAYLYSLGVAIQSRKVTRVRENSYQGNSRRFETKHVTG